MTRPATSPAANVELVHAGFQAVSTGDTGECLTRIAPRPRHSGEFLGFPATGRTIEYVSHEFYRIADGLIAEEWICSDMATLLSQLS